MLQIMHQESIDKVFIETVADIMEARFASLKNWTLTTLHGQRVQIQELYTTVNELEEKSANLDESIVSLRRDIDLQRDLCPKSVYCASRRSHRRCEVQLKVYIQTIDCTF